MHASWSRVMRAAYEQLRRDIEAGRPTLLGEDAAEDPSEFLAFATESFFTTPARLKQEHPDVYDQLRAFYRQDPLQRDRI